MSAMLSLWDYVPPAQDNDLFRELVTIARQFATRNGLRGVTIGEVVQEAERRGRKVGGVPMEDKAKEQRQTSWLPRVMKVNGANLRATKAKRPSPLDRHHGKEQTIWVLPELYTEERQ